MKNFAYPLFFLSVLFFADRSIAQPGAYIIGGHVPPAPDNKRVTLHVFDPISQEKKVTAMAVTGADGSYRLGYIFQGPELYTMTFPGGQEVMLAVDEGQNNIVLNISPDGDSIEISGSPDSEKLQGYDQFRAKSFRRLVQPTYDAMKSAGDAGDKLAGIEAVAAYAQASEQRHGHFQSQRRPFAVGKA
ncbi:MAG: hypothetical protein EPO28_04815 [Saprospiraceae bacterium]|nr:MAG: hypothetical protein EPO28_04815 [Saprospiraceae bacterium]